MHHTRCCNMSTKLKATRWRVLTEYVKRLKQSHDVLWSHIGTRWQEEFVENRDTYKNAKDDQMKTNLKDLSVDHYIADLLMYISDNAKYQSLLMSLRSLYSLKNNQYKNSAYCD